LQQGFRPLDRSAACGHPRPARHVEPSAG
jgi:hypothetical protein